MEASAQESPNPVDDDRQHGKSKDFFDSPYTEYPRQGLA